MTQKRFILLIVISFILIAFACAFLGIGIFLEPFSTVALSLLIVASLCSSVGAFILIAFNYKKLIAFQTQRKKEELANVDFTSVNYPLKSPMEIKQILLERGYYEDYRFALTYERVVHKGKTTCTEYYHETSFEEQGIFDVNEGMKFAEKSYRYYFCVIFIQNNLEENLKNLKNYIVDTAISDKIFDNKFFCPLIISQGKLYFLNTSVSHRYKTCLTEALRALGIDNHQI
ncbi:MAG: hypothetical protein IJ400_03920 [Clostridia bacterium]|nr:hypothetical protein [Clostridia bacterium]